MPPAPSAKAWGAAAGAALCLGLASPPGAFPGAGWLVVPGLALLYFVVVGPHRPALLAYLAGALYMAVFSWSLRHIVLAAYVGVAVVGGCYFAILPRWVKGLAALRVPPPVGFAVAIAGSFWLRAHMPEIWYPHGQPAHALHAFPALLLGPASLGGEVLVNLLLAGAAAAAVDAIAGPRRRPAGVVLLAAGAIWLAAGLLRPTWRPPAPSSTPIDIAAIQPGLTVEDLFQRDADVLRARQRATLLRPTLAVAGADVATPPDLVLWPEGTSHVELLIDATGRGQLATASWWCAESPLPLASRTKLLLGGHLHSPEHDGLGVALLLDNRGRLLDHHEKVRLVPGGERQPFVGLLPDAWSVALRDSMARAMGSAPHLTPGRSRPPLAVVEGVRAGALICYDNAFAEVARRHVEDGANLLVVLSNEVWYRLGAELDQLAAMTVLRAQETGVPIVRCTVDGATLAVDAQGAILGQVPRGSSETLRIRLAAPSVSGPVAPAARIVAAASTLSLLLAIAQGLWAWATLRRPQHRTMGPSAASKMPVVGA